MGIVEGLSMGVVEGLRSEIKNFEDPRGMSVLYYKKTKLIVKVSSISMKNKSVRKGAQINLFWRKRVYDEIAVGYDLHSHNKCLQ